ATVDVATVDVATVDVVAAGSLLDAGADVVPAIASNNCSNSASVISPLASLLGSMVGDSSVAATETSSGCCGAAGSALASFKSAQETKRSSEAISAGSTGGNSSRCETSSNCWLTISNACKTTSINSDVTVRLPLRKISNRFSVTWQHSTIGVSA